jgi:hypothetical protein
MRNWFPKFAFTKRDDLHTATTRELHYDANTALGFESEVRVARVTGAGTLEDVAGSGEHDDEDDKNDDTPEVGLYKSNAVDL